MDKRVPTIGIRYEPRHAAVYLGPRKTVRKRSLRIRRVVNLLVWCTLAAAAFLISSSLLSGLCRPIKLLSREYREMRAIECELAKLRRQNEVLERRIAYLKSPRGAEQKARELGYVKPGEITLIFPE